MDPRDALYWKIICEGAPGFPRPMDLCKGKGKVFPYSLPIVGPGADPSVQAVSPQVT